MNMKIYPDDLESVQLKEIPSTIRRARAVSSEKSREIGDEVRKARNNWYGLWYQCLKLSEEYVHCCANHGKGRLRGMYLDFGDVRQPFATWWMKTGRYVFAERKEVADVVVYEDHRDLEDIRSLRGKLLIEVPLNIRHSTVVRKINKILKQAYEGKEVVPREQSTARRKLAKSKLRISTVKTMLELYELRQLHPDLTLWQLGERAGIELDLMARTTDEVSMTVQQERVRMNIAISRYLRQARELIWNATEGVFPSVKPFANQNTNK
jgi:hypothetical protein